MQGAESFYEDVLRIQSPHLAKELAKCTTEMHLSKGEVLVHEGEQQHQFVFLTDGILRGFFVDANGREVTDCFAFRVGTAVMACVASGSPALFSIEALTDCSFYQIDSTTLLSLMRQEPQLLWIYNSLLEQALQTQWTIKTMLCQHTAMERYQWFLEAYPGLIDQVSNRYVASFLGITPVTLSRLRRELRERDRPSADKI